MFLLYAREIILMLTKNKKLTIFKYVCLICYILCVAVLVFEACMDGKNSSQQSNAVGGTLADIINALRGDQTQVVNPEYLEIENSISTCDVGDTFKLDVVTYPETQPINNCHIPQATVP